MRFAIRIEKFRGRKGVFWIRRTGRTLSRFEVDLSLWLYGFNLELATGFWPDRE